MADKRPSVAAAFLSVLGLGGVAVAVVAIAVSFSASSAQRIAVADREIAAAALLQQRQVATGLISSELAGSIVDAIGDEQAMIAAPLTARRTASIETALAIATKLDIRGDSVGNEAQRWLSAMTIETDPAEIDDYFDRFVAYDAYANAACCLGIVPSDNHHTDGLRNLEAAAAVSGNAWDYLYIATELTSRTPPSLPPSVNRFLDYLATPASLAADAQLASERYATDLSTLGELGVSQEAINLVLTGHSMSVLDQVVLAASGRTTTIVSVDDAYIAADAVHQSVDELYTQTLQITSNRLTDEQNRAEQVRLVATVVAPILLLVLAGIGIVIYRSARNREQALKHERDLLDARNRFVRMVSHELRTPATAISGFAQMLSNDWTALTEPEISEFLAIVDRQSTHLSLIVNDLLTLSHLETGRLRLHLSQVNLKKAADEAIGMVDARYGIEVDTSIDPDITLVADPDRLVQILRNLVENAAKYGTADVAVAATTTERECTIGVSDSGPGVPAEAVERIFRFWDRGAREDDRARGPGLGLAIARHLTRAMVGDLIYQPHQPI
ncbi:MAG: HAMP domain-containing sensor histidine kinase, partial [Acidimicrobiia bacterium]|nr:HAMP domain-containing sensor histidine kinase [Acidimicrobiia bacterium]MDX2465758.1 HAMP domain-containing sensor histidine kinase [Acidimicrobiia bacterium]